MPAGGDAISAFAKAKPTAKKRHLDAPAASRGKIMATLGLGRTASNKPGCARRDTSLPSDLIMGVSPAVARQRRSYVFDAKSE